MKQEIKLLKDMAKTHRTYYSEKGMSKMNNLGQADVDDLIKQGYIEKSKTFVHNKEKNASEAKFYYAITTKGYLLLKDLRDRKWQISSVIIGGIVLIITLTSLVIQIIK